jgi:SNF2 family DNA or RNA helicase
LGNVIAKERSKKGRRKDDEDDDDDDEMEEVEGLRISEVNLNATRKLLKCFRLRRSLGRSDLPGKKTCQVLVSMTEAQKEWYGRLDQQDNKAHKVERKNCDLHPMIVKPMRESAELVRLAVEGSNKFKFILQALDVLLREDSASKHKVLIFSTSLYVLYLLGEVLANEGFRAQIISGLDSNSENRSAILDRFNRPSDDTIQVLLLSTKAMAEGLQMQGADTVIFHDHHYNPQTDNQAEGRAYRTGQRRPVLVIRLVVKGSLEAETMESIVRRKRSMQMLLELDEPHQPEAPQESMRLSRPEDLRALLLERGRYRDLPQIKRQDDAVCEFEL